MLQTALLVLAVLCGASVVSGRVQYKTPTTTADGKINVHLIPHSHDDVGWKKTLDQYLYDTDNVDILPGGLDSAGVLNTLHSVTLELSLNPNRTFTEVEQAFFSRFYNEDLQVVTDMTHGFVKSGQMEFVNGGWSMHDEAATSWIDQIDNTALGHRFILEHFNVTPTVGWQIDPFGHSSTNALFSSLYGFDALYFARIDYQDRIVREADKRLQMVWNPSPSYTAEDAALLTGVMYQGYGPPPKINWDLTRASIDTPQSSSPIIDNKNSPEYNVEETIQYVEDQLSTWAKGYPTDHLMVPMGTDFAYTAAQNWYLSMDRLIHYGNQLSSKFHFLYSTPSVYTKALYDSGFTFTTKTDDFFPYASQANGFWTGYFSSRPGVKGYIRSRSALLQAARQLEAAVGRKSVTTDLLEEAMGVCQHHDAVTGTERQKVADDYMRRLAQGTSAADQVVSDAFVSLAQLPAGTTPTACIVSNVSICEITQAAKPGSTVSVIAYNPLAQDRVSYIRVPINSASVSVKTASGTAVPAQVVNATVASDRRAAPGLGGGHASATSSHTLVFEASLQAMGWATFSIELGSSSSSSSLSSPSSAVVARETHHSLADDVTIGNKHVTLEFSAGRMTKMSNSDDGVSAAFTEDRVGFYDATGSNSSRVNSGAYLFTPEEFTLNVLDVTSWSSVTGPVVQEVRINYGAWASKVVRVYTQQAHVEVELTLGPLPNDLHGREVIQRYNSSVNSGSTFFTDSNGREYLERQLNYRPTWKLNQTNPVSGNFFPLTSGMYVEDSSTRLNLFMDRAVSGSSLASGEMEILVHRRLFFDDSKGLFQPLNETADGCVDCGASGLVIRTNHYLALNNLKAGTDATRLVPSQVYLPARSMFFNGPASASAKPTGSLIAAALPSAVMVPTMQALSYPPSTFLVRLAHQYAAGEADNVTVDLKTLFPEAASISVQERSLSGNQGLAEMQANRLHFKHSSSASESTSPTSPSPLTPIPSGSTTVTLSPMHIRTFFVTQQD